MGEMNSSPAHPRPRVRWSLPLTLIGMSTLVLAYSVLVYVIPTSSGHSVTSAYDAFTYALMLSDDAETAREFQPFLSAYPGHLSRSMVQLYGAALHLSLLALPVLVLHRVLGQKACLVILTALAIPESAIFLGAVSKEGLGIVAVTAVFAASALYFRQRYVGACFMAAYAVGIAEFSRPGYGVPFAVAMLAGLIPAFPRRVRRSLPSAALIAFAVGAWMILAGPYREEFTEQYQTARTFLEWFEENMGSDSPIKGAVRAFFSAVFGSEEPSFFLLVLIAIAALGKALIYLLAVPLISPPSYQEMPAQTWALTWQVATSISTAVVIVSLWPLRKISLTVEDRSRLWFAFSLLFLISISTAIFHVRYRAPAVVAILAASWLANRRPQHSTWMTVAALGASSLAILTT